MAGRSIIENNRTATGLGSIDGSIAYLEQQTWWRAFREARLTSAQQIDDALWVGHFCRWLERRRTALDRCTPTDLHAYLTSIASFRPGPRAACQRTVTALVDFLAARAPETAQSSVERV
jgi:hypothetical protein